MKAVLLAGGLGTRLGEETDVKPKPMVLVGEKPIIWHIMKYYSGFGINDFIICLGYKGYAFKEFFANYLLHMSDVTIDVRSNKIDIHHHEAEPWKITLVETGLDTMTGGRLKRVAKYLENDEAFCMTYGDGVSDVDIGALVESHRTSGCLATMTAVQPPGRFGALGLEDNLITSFHEKPEGDGAWINGGFFVLSPKVLDYVEDDSTVWEQAPLKTLAAERQLNAYMHRGFWQCMDTLRDKKHLEDLWKSGSAPWKHW
jgi:glucose-1-phosphate cytidylyltransferase